jgi:tetraacyldisaccharide 4'-kinase
VTIPEAIYAHFYRRRKKAAQARRVRFENVRVFSIGNLTVGGTGKTPAVQWLARRLESAGIATVIVARGYGGEYSRCGAVVSDGARVLLDARQAGDEAMLHARALPQTPVVIGRDRVAAAKIAIEKFAPQAIVLDDGFQFWSLARDFDLVLLDARRPFGNLKLLPSGRLREPATEAARASGVLLTRANAVSPQKLEQSKRNVRFFTAAPIFVASHTPVGLRDEGSGEILTLEKLRGRRVAALSALANNQSFFDSLRALGAQVGSTLERRDHHRWRENEVRAFAERAQKDGAQAIVTTEKDAVKIEARWCAPLPLWSLQIALQIENEDDLWRLIEKYLS